MHKEEVLSQPWAVWYCHNHPDETVGNTKAITVTKISPLMSLASLAGQTFAARGGEGGAREGGKRTSGHFRQVSVAWRNSKT